MNKLGPQRVVFNRQPKSIPFLATSLFGLDVRCRVVVPAGLVGKFDVSPRNVKQYAAFYTA